MSSDPIIRQAQKELAEAGLSTGKKHGLAKETRDRNALLCDGVDKQSVRAHLKLLKSKRR